MENLSVQQLESTASWYQELLVPALFERWTDQVLDEARLNATDRLLDVACGTGVLARAAANQLGTKGLVEGLDMNPGMLEVAKNSIQILNGMKELLRNCLGRIILLMPSSASLV